MNFTAESTRMERIAKERLDAAIEDVACDVTVALAMALQPSGITVKQVEIEARLREFARAVAMVATTAAFGLDPNPESAVERMVAS